MDGLAVATVIGASITAVAAILAALIAQRSNKKNNQVLRELTVNGGENTPPTFLDKFSILEDRLEELRTDHKDHIHWHLEK